MLEKGKEIGKNGEYKLIESIGSGNFGVVWKAEKRTALDVNYFALKFFRPKNELSKIRKEISIWKQLKGLPHIISVTELDQFENYIYVVSDFADGGSLEKWMQANNGKAHSIEEAVKIILEILTGLENLHEKGFVHRDLKPDNILIMNSKHCLADFGISREIKTHSKATGTAGTLEYMSPESFDNKVSLQSDIWAVGVMLQELLSGKLPYDEETPQSLMMAIVRKDPKPLPKEIPSKLRKIVEQSLQKDRKKRFKTASEMRSVLQEFLQNPDEVSELEVSQTYKPTIIDKDFDDGQVQGLDTDADENEEKSYWEKVQKVNTIESYRAYILQYPNGKFTDLCKRKIVDLEKEKQHQEAQKRIDEKEKLLWENTLKRNTIEDYYKYLEIYPQGKFADSCDRKISLIKRNEVEKETQRQQEKENQYQKDIEQIFEPIKKTQLNYSTRIFGGVSVLLILFLGIIGVSFWQSQNTSITNSIGIEFVKIPSGSFMMGSPSDEKDRDNDEGPQRRVTISKDFYMGKYEVTQEEYEKVMGKNPSNFKNCPSCPVEEVSWNDAKEFIKRLNEKDDKYRYRLPSEAEWEYAARAGTTTPFGIGDGNNLSSDEANFDGNYPYGNASKGKYLEKTTKVGSYKPNKWGLYDMHGNVWEWCEDSYQDSYQGLPWDGSANVSVGDSSYRVLRGGSWYNSGSGLRSAVRGGVSPSTSSAVFASLLR